MEKTGARRLVLAYGDSLTNGYHGFGRHAPWAPLMTLPSDMVAEAEGHDGYRTGELLEPLRRLLKEPRLVEMEMDAFVLLAGTNDLSVVAEKEILDNLEALAATAARRFRRVFVMTIPLFPNLVKLRALVEKLERINDAIRRREAVKSATAVIDLARVVTPDLKGIWDDGLHPNPDGYLLYARAVQDAVLA